MFDVEKAFRSATICNGVELYPSGAEIISGWDAGMGLFADQFFECGSYITQYDGVFCMHGREPAYNLPLEERSHVLRCADGYVIFGNKDYNCSSNRGGGQFVNHADPRSGRVNAVIRCFDLSFKNRIHREFFGRDEYYAPVPFAVYVVALRDIYPGEEIFVNYGRGYFSLTI